jgi:hypothetical protein
MDNKTIPKKWGKFKYVEKRGLVMKEPSENTISKEKRRPF